MTKDFHSFFFFNIVEVKYVWRCITFLNLKAKNYLFYELNALKSIIPIENNLKLKENQKIKYQKAKVTG